MSVTNASAAADPSARRLCEGCGQRPATHDLDEQGRGECADCAARYAADYAKAADVVEQRREVLDQGRRLGLDDGWLESACQDALTGARPPHA